MVSVFVIQHVHKSWFRNCWILVFPGSSNALIVYDALLSSDSLFWLLELTSVVRTVPFKVNCEKAFFVDISTKFIAYDHVYTDFAFWIPIVCWLTSTKIGFGWKSPSILVRGIDGSSERIAAVHTPARGTLAFANESMSCQYSGRHTADLTQVQRMKGKHVNQLQAII